MGKILYVNHKLKIKMKFKTVLFTLLFQDDTHLPYIYIYNIGGNLPIVFQGEKTPQSNKHKTWKYIIGGEIFIIYVMPSNCLM